MAVAHISPTALAASHLFQMARHGSVTLHGGAVYARRAVAGCRRLCLRSYDGRRHIFSRKWWRRRSFPPRRQTGGRRGPVTPPANAGASPSTASISAFRYKRNTAGCHIGGIDRERVLQVPRSCSLTRESHTRRKGRPVTIGRIARYARQNKSGRQSIQATMPATPERV